MKFPLVLAGIFGGQLKRDVFQRKKKRSRLSKISPDKFRLKVTPTPPWIEASAQWARKAQVKRSSRSNSSSSRFSESPKHSSAKLERIVLRALKKKIGVIDATITDSKFTQREFHVKGLWLSLRTYVWNKFDATINLQSEELVSYHMTNYVA